MRQRQPSQDKQFASLNSIGSPQNTKNQKNSIKHSMQQLPNSIPKNQFLSIIDNTPGKNTSRKNSYNFDTQNINECLQYIHLSEQLTQLKGIKQNYFCVICQVKVHDPQVCLSCKYLFCQKCLNLKMKECPMKCQNGNKKTGKENIQIQSSLISNQQKKLLKIKNHWSLKKKYLVEKKCQPEVFQKNQISNSLVIKELIKQKKDLQKRMCYSLIAMKKHIESWKKSKNVVYIRAESQHSTDEEELDTLIQQNIHAHNVKNGQKYEITHENNNDNNKNIDKNNNIEDTHKHSQKHSVSFKGIEMEIMEDFLDLLDGFNQRTNYHLDIQKEFRKSQLALLRGVRKGKLNDENEQLSQIQKENLWALVRSKKNKDKCFQKGSCCAIF